MTALLRSPWRRVALFLALLFWLSLPAHADGTRVAPFTGPGGVEVLLAESHANPMVEVRILVPGGSARDPAGKAGVASLTAWMFNEGGGDLDSEGFRERLDFYGIALGADAGRESLEVSLTTLTEHLDEAWARLADALLRPRFDPRDFARARSERIAELTKSQEEPAVRAALALQRLIYPGHPYAEPVSGDLESIPRIELEDVRQRHFEAFRGAGMVMAVAGDIDMARLQALMDRHLSGLNPQPGPFQPLPLAETPAVGRHEHIEMDIPQTTLRLGIVGINRQDPDYYALQVMNQILGGGGLSSRLNEEIREKRGLAYGVFSYFSPLPARGVFVVGTKTKTASTAETLELIRREIRRMADEGVGEEELAETKLYLTGSFPLHLDGLGKLADNWSTIGYFRRGLDYLDRWPDRIRAVTREQVQGVARRILDLDRFQVVTVGRSETTPPPETVQPLPQ